MACNLAYKQSVHIKLKYTFISKERKVPDKYGGYEGSDYENGNVDSNELVAAMNRVYNANVNNEADGADIPFLLCDEVIMGSV